MRLLVKNGLILTVSPGRQPFVGYLLVDDHGRIARIGAGKAPPGMRAEATLDARDKFIVPGFISAHSHLFHSPLRGLASDQTLYPWLGAIRRLLRFAKPEDIYWFCRHGAVDFLRNGITTAYDFTYSGDLGGGQHSIGTGGRPAGPPPDQEPYEAAQVQAKLDAGIRFINSVSVVPRGSEPEIRARFARIVEAASRHAGSPFFLKMAISGWVQRAPDRSAAEREVHLMRTYGLMNQAHFLESPERVAEQRAKFSWYRDAGALGPDFVFGHFVQTSRRIVAQTAAAGARMCWQPLANGRLASGVADIPAILSAGIAVGIGLDDQSCSDHSDPFENMRQGLYAVRARYRRADVLSPRDMLRLHTLGSAQILGLDDRLGSLERSKAADFLVVDPRDPDTGPVHDPIASLVLACGLRNLKQVYLGGRLVASGSAVIGQSSDRLKREVDERMAALIRLSRRSVSRKT